MLDTMDIVNGVIASIIATVLLSGLGLAWRWSVGRRIAITEPVENGELAPAENRNGVIAHRVEGTLKHKPKDHRIWLLVIDEAGGKVWPQGFEPVVYDEKEGRWKGYVHVWGWNNVTITAVVSPRSTRDFFEYFQKVGEKTNYAPLLRIPPDCKKRATVHARVPKPSHPPAPPIT